MTTLLLARHGETDWNRDHLWQGHTGPPLNQTGRQQAADLGLRIRAIDAVYVPATVDFPTPNGPLIHTTPP